MNPDIEAEHSVPEQPRSAGNRCPRCKGAGKVENDRGESVPCPACEGTGRQVVGHSGG